MKILAKTFGLVALGAFFALTVSSTVKAENGYCTGAVVLEAGAKTVNGVTQNAVLMQNSQAANACGNWPAKASYWFVLDTANQDGMLATALTALSLGRPVTIVSKGVNSYTNWGALIHVSVKQ